MASSGVSGNVRGYEAAFLTVVQQERYASVKTKLCGHKAVDVADLQKNVMGSIVAAMGRLKWTKIATLSEVSYPDLVKAFYVCLKIEEDETLTSMVKGTQIRVTRDLLASLFGVTTSGHNGVHTVDIQAKVPRSATFSTCSKADSDLMFWAVQNQEINTAEIMIERMKFASAQVWDTKSKLNVSLPYAHLLTKIFQHYGISVTKASVAEGEAIIGEAQEGQEAAGAVPAIPKVEAVQAAAEPEVVVALSVEAEAAAAAESSSRIEDIPLENIEPVGHRSEDPLPDQGEQVVAHEDSVIEDAPIKGEQHVDEQVAIQGEQEIIVEEDQLEDAPAQGEQSFEKEGAPQGEHTKNTSMNDQFSEEHADFVEPIAGSSSCQEVPGLGGEAKRRRIRGEEGSLKFFPEFFKLLTQEEENDQSLRFKSYWAMFAHPALFVVVFSCETEDEPYTQEDGNNLE
ncbi:hypothetical protein Taro_043418 [Colocasia esculenta]|uniref:Uncharacterized protein n=1 Tax=Colocasia esculenta TaxID=4460 RepID=A0A843WGE1_COLES|nr:hypothetical protein [Colocasia esculenta]